MLGLSVVSHVHVVCDGQIILGTSLTRLCVAVTVWYDIIR
jgi:hypothetical protein